MEPGRLLPPQTSLSAGLAGLASMDIAAGHRLLGSKGKLKIQFPPLVGRGKKHGAGHHLAKKSLGEEDMTSPTFSLPRRTKSNQKLSPCRRGALTNHSGYLVVLTVSQELGQGLQSLASLKPHHLPRPVSPCLQQAGAPSARRSIPPFHHHLGSTEDQNGLL